MIVIAKRKQDNMRNALSTLNEKLNQTKIMIFKQVIRIISLIDLN